MSDKLTRTLSEVLGVDSEAITDGMSIEDLEAWDSLNHLLVIAAIEEAFSVKFETEEMVKMTSVKQIREALAGKRHAASA